MKFLLLRSAVLICLMSIMRIAIAVQLDSSSFTHQYNGDMYPIPDYAAPYGLFRVAPSSDGDILTYASYESTPLFWENYPWPVNNATGWTFEVRAKIDDDLSDGGGGAFSINLSDSVSERVFIVG